jgi:eukaryotic-like serine/threonine-protein kinase
VDDATELMHAWPAFLPDNRHFLYWIHARGPDRGKDAVIIGSLDGTPDSKERRRLMLSSSQAAFSAGHVLFEREGALMARPFDDTRLEWRGDPFPVAAHVRRFVPRYGWGAFSVSSTGTLAYHTGIGWPSRTQLAWFDRGGTEVRRLGQPVDQFAPKISPDQQRVAVVQGDSQGKLDVWLIDVARDSRTRLTASTALSSLPIWSPDGTRILFNSNRGDSWDLYVKPSNGVGSEELLLKSNVAKLATDWSPNGVVIYQQRQPNRGYDIWAVPVEGDRKPWPVVQSEFNDINGQISPNGRWLAYESDESLHSEIYVQGFPQSSGKLRVSTGGGTRPRWNHNGRELFYLSPDRKMMSVDVQSDGATFVIGRTRELFQTRAADAPFVASVYDVTKDGKLFLISTAAEADTPPPTTIVINFAQKR